jgi:prepilin-type N-terminal cleavage/methylation domain-containing protein
MYLRRYIPVLPSLSSALEAAAAWVFSPPGNQPSYGAVDVSSSGPRRRAKKLLATPASGHRPRHVRYAQAGFTLVELMVALAVIAVISSVAAPNLNGWMRIYRLKSAAMDLYSNMQLAKVNAVKENREWRIDFDSTNSTYRIVKCLKLPACETGTDKIDYEVFKTVNLKTDYGNAIQYKHPSSLPVIDNDPLSFYATGLTETGKKWTYLSDNVSSKYYRIGSESLAGSIHIQIYDGTTWR